MRFGLVGEPADIERLRSRLHVDDERDGNSWDERMLVSVCEGQGVKRVYRRTENGQVKYTDAGRSGAGLYVCLFDDS